MKNNILNIKLLGLLFIMVALFTTSCNEEELISYPSGDGETEIVQNGFVSVRTSVVPFIAGTEDYNIAFDVINGVVPIETVTAFITFSNSAGDMSEPIVFDTYTITDPLIENISVNVTYDDLREGISFKGMPLPEDESDVAIGSSWTISFEGTLANGDEIPVAGSVFVGVLSPYAGRYKVIESSYFRIGEDNGGWNGEERFIGSIDENTYSHPDFWGNFAWAGSTFYFDINEDNSITVPTELPDGLFSGDRAITCATDPGMFVNVPCTNELVVMDNGKHIIKLTYGYFTEGSGPREFYEILEKIVD